MVLALHRAQGRYTRLNYEYKELERGVINGANIIEAYKKEKLALERQLHELQNPSFTQVLMNPATLERIDHLEQICNADATIKHLERIRHDQDRVIAEQKDRIDQLQVVNYVAPVEPLDACPLDVELPYADIEVCTAPAPVTVSSVGTKRKCVPRRVTPGSITRTCKRRTRNNARVPAKIFSPDVGKSSMIVIGSESEVDEDDGRAYKGDPFPVLNSKFEAVKKIDRKVLDVLVDGWRKDGPGCIVYDGTHMLGKVVVRHCRGVLEHERLGSFFIDAWGEFVKELYRSTCPRVDDVMTFPACIWGELRSQVSSSVLRKWVDERIEEALEKEVLLFPVNPCLNERSSDLHGDHWVLLKYVVKEDMWYFYNSLPPRSQGGTDYYYKQSQKLIKYVETQMRMVMLRTNPEHPMLGRQPSNIRVQIPKSWVHEFGTLDCGVVVCNLIELFVLGLEGGVGQYTLAMAGDYRCKLVHWFVCPYDANC